MKNTGQAYSDNDAQEKSFRRWWDRLTEHSWQLFKANLCYLPFVLPAYVCIVVFFIFNAWLFFLAGLILIIPVGPAMLTLYEVTVNIAAGRPRDELPRFFSAYRIRWRHGLVLSFVLLAACVIVVYPVYFALVTNSEMKVMIVACAVTAALLLCSLLPHYSSLVISKERSGLLRKSIAYALRSGKAGFFAGLLQAVWLVACMAYPYVAVFAMLLGMPAAVRMTSSYILQMTTDVQAEI